MNHILSLETVDRDGALREAANDVSGDTRLSFLQKAGLGAGAMMGGGRGLGGVQALKPAIAAAPAMAQRRANKVFRRNEAAKIITGFPGGTISGRAY